MKKAYFYIGLPGSGKTTLIENEVKKLDSYKLVSADTLKENHSSYDPLNAHLLHKWSVDEAEKLMDYYSKENTPNIIFDSGGINDNYSKRIMNLVKSRGYEINLTIIDTPLVICLERIEKRERKVPYEDMFHKSFKIKQCIFEQSQIADRVTRISYYKNDSLFLDMDGVLAAFQVFPLKNKFAHDDLSVDYIDNNIFTHARPVVQLINKITLDINLGKYKDIFILSVSPNNKCSQEKKEWLNKYLPYIQEKNMFFVGSAERKVKTLNHIMNNRKLNRENVLYVDDVHSMLWEAVNQGINAVHPSMFLTM